MATESTAMGAGLTSAGPSDDEVSRALDRLAKARIRIRDVAGRCPAPARSRVESIERAHRAVVEATVALSRRPDEPEVIKTHALAEIAEVMALRAEGYPTLADYELTVSPPLTDPVAAELGKAEQALTDAQRAWDVLKQRLVAPGEDTTIDLTREPPVVDTGR